MKRISRAGLLLAFVALAVPLPAHAQCGIPGQYQAADGTCQCPPGYYHDRSTVACEQIECPAGAGRTYTLECACPEGTVPEYTGMTTETGLPYNLITACVPPGESGAEGAGVVETILFPSAVFVSPRDRMRDGWDSMTRGRGVERLAGAASLAGLLAEAGLSVVTLGGLATAAATRVSGMWAGRQAGAAATRAAGHLASRAAAAEMGQIASQTQGPLRELVRLMGQAGIPVSPDNVLRLINEARGAQGLAPWGRSNLAIIRRGIGLVR